MSEQLQQTPTTPPENNEITVAPSDSDGLNDLHNEQSSRELVDLPLARVKRIMKSDADIKLVSQEALVLVTKAAELLLQTLASESFRHTQQENRKTMQYKDLCMCECSF